MKYKMLFAKREILISILLFTINNTYSMSNSNQYNVPSLKFQSGFAFSKFQKKLPENLPIPQELSEFLKLVKKLEQGKYSPEVLCFFRNIVDGVCDNGCAINNVKLLVKSYGEARANKNSELINKLLKYIEIYSNSTDQFANIIKKLLAKRKPIIEKYILSCSADGISDFSHFLGQWHNTANGTDLEVALLYAVAHGHYSILKFLLRCNVNVNACDVTNWTALFYAAANGYASAVQLLINCNANINARDKNMSTPLHYAVLYGRLNTVKILLDAAADINAQDKYGSTPLMYAYLSHNKDMVDLLLTYNPDLNIVNYYNQSNADYENSQYSYLLNTIQKLFLK